jgi:type I restriction enzyme S subunit
MNPAQLLEYFDRISDAPDAVPRLRQFILELAVRGKLVEQDPKDEPASNLLKRIQAEKARLVKVGQIRAQQSLPPLLAEEIPFQVPKQWHWLRLGEIGLTQTGTTPSSNNPEYFGDYIPFVKPAALTGNPIDYSGVGISKDGVEHSRLIPKNSALMVCIGSSIGKVNVTDRDVCCNQQINAVTPHLEHLTKFTSFSLKSDYFQKLVLASAGMGTLPIISKGKWEILPIPLPPLAEQHRIVAKVDELMALCDRLEAAQAEREGRRDRLAAASLHRLNQPAAAGNPQAFREHASFHLKHLPRLASRPEHIKQLRQTILNLAVRGQLVPQDPNDEPASELLKRIHGEKAKLVKEGIIKKVDSIALPAGSEFPSPMPLGWTPSNLQSLCISVTDGDHIPPPKADQGIPFLVIGNVRSQTVNFAGCRHVSEQYYNALDTIRRPQKGDILYTLVGSYGIPIMITDDKPFCVQRHIGILRPSLAINARFLSRILESQWVFDQATSYATGIAQKTVPLAGLRRILIPLPPLAEQHRIVAKVDELMALCDQLETQLTTAQSESRRLLESVLHQALNG